MKNLLLKLKILEIKLKTSGPIGYFIYCIIGIAVMIAVWGPIFTFVGWILTPFTTPILDIKDFGSLSIFGIIGYTFLIIIIFIWFRSYKFDQVRNDYNLELTFNNNEIYQKNSNEIIQLLKKNSESLEFIRQDRDESGKIELNIRIRFKEFEQIKTVTKKLQEIDKALIKFSIYETKILF